MNKIVLKHSRIEINNYELGDAARLEYIFSIWDPITHKSYPKGIEYIEEQHQLRLPRGIDIDYVKNIFMDEPYVDTKCDPFVNTDQLKIRYLPRDTRQYNIIKFILGIDDYNYTITKSQLCCNSTTGSGKTYTTVAAICYAGYRAIIITNSLGWLDQWRERIKEYTQLTDDDIYTISGAASINKIMRRDPLKYQIFLASHSTIKSYGDRCGWNMIEDFFKHIQVALKVYDEAHLYFDNMCKIDFHSNTKKTLYLTATPERSSREENNIYQLYFKNVPSIVLFDEENDPHVHYNAIHFSSHPTPLDINRCKNQYGLDRNKYVNYVVNRPFFKMLTIVLMDMTLGINGKVLIYVGTNAAIKIVVDYVVSMMPFLQDYIGIYTSVVDPAVKQSMLCKKFIFSTTKSCGAAMDITDLAVTINLAEPFKSKVISKQTLGRCRADNTLYIDVVDHGFYQTKRYYESKKPVFSTYAKSCKDIFMSDQEITDRFNAIVEKYNTHRVMCMPVFKE